jgi:hypothetical protein
MNDMKSIFLFLLLFLLSCNNPIALKPIAENPIPVHIFAEKRLAAKTLTDFLAIGYQIDTVANSYSSLKYDSIEAINYLNEGMVIMETEDSIQKEIPKDTIYKRHVLNAQQTEHLIKVLDDEKTYDLEYRSKCFVPHLMFIFYSQDTIVAHCSICFHCINSYSTINSKKYGEINLSESGDQILSKLCKDLNFSDCKMD